MVASPPSSVQASSRARIDRNAQKALAKVTADGGRVFTDRNGVEIIQDPETDNFAKCSRRIKCPGADSGFGRLRRGSCHNEAKSSLCQRTHERNLGPHASSLYSAMPLRPCLQMQPLQTCTPRALPWGFILAMPARGLPAATNGLSCASVLMHFLHYFLLLHHIRPAQKKSQGFKCSHAEHVPRAACLAA